jgi:tRNA nucleotidyltransferase (CCA-adding enzyme)
VTFPISPALRSVLDAIVAGGGRPAVIGGSVRDWIMGLEPKDIDVEVYDLSVEALEKALAPFKVDAVGKSFGVLKVTTQAVYGNQCRYCGEPAKYAPSSGLDFPCSCAGQTFDVSLPRRESKEGRGHKGFLISADPTMSPQEAAARRDFTVNTVGWDYITNSLIDFHGGVADIKAKVLRHTSPAFAEDPLRVLRGCQFAARFGFTMEPETVALCRTLAGELPSLPVERLWVEWTKMLVKGRTPSLGLYRLVDTGAIDLFPEVKALIGVPQEFEWHPEGADHPLGSLWVHNCMVTDMAVKVLDDDGVTDPEERMIVMLGAFCHDFGKPSTTKFERDRWRSLGHEEAGEAPTRSFLARIGAPPGVIEAVVPLVQHHLKPFVFGRSPHASPSAVRRLALKAPLVRLCRVARADYMGRTTKEALAVTDSREIAETKWLLSKAEELAVRDAAPKPLLQGRHLIDLGYKPGKLFGEFLKLAFEAQLDGVFGDEAAAIEWAGQLLQTAPQLEAAILTVKSARS